MWSETQLRFIGGYTLIFSINTQGILSPVLVCVGFFRNVIRIFCMMREA